MYDFKKSASAGYRGYPGYPLCFYYMKLLFSCKFDVER